MRKRAVKGSKKCSGCGKPRDRGDQRYCRACHAAAQAGFRAGDKMIARFAGLVMREARGELGDLDGGWLQDRMIECELLHEVRVEGPCSEEHCRCAEYHGSDGFPAECLRPTALGQRVLRLSDRQQDQSKA